MSVDGVMGCFVSHVCIQCIREWKLLFKDKTKIVYVGGCIWFRVITCNDLFVIVCMYVRSGSRVLLCGRMSLQT